MKRDPAGSPLERLNKNNAGTRIHIPHAEAQRFPKTNDGAVENEHQCPVYVGSKRWTLEVRAEREQFHNLAFGEVVRYEARYGRKSWPTGLDDAKVRKPSKHRKHGAIGSPKVQLANLFAGQDYRRAKLSVRALKFGHSLVRLGYQMCC